MSKKYTISVDGRCLDVFMEHQTLLKVGEEEFNVDFTSIDEKTYSLIINGKSLNVFQRGEEERAAGLYDLDSTYRLQIDGQEFLVTVDDERSLLLKSMLRHRHSSRGPLTVHAPMPGLVSKLEVTEGENVHEGQGLIVLEAMKMENELKATRQGRVEKIHVKTGSAVEKGEPLITLVGNDGL